MDKVIECINISKEYSVNGNPVPILKDINISLNEGDFLIILGPSGSGKSTLLNIMSGIDFPSSGKVLIENQDISKLNEKQLDILRAKKIGYVFQDYGLIPIINCYDNVGMSFINKSHYFRKKRNEEEKYKQYLPPNTDTTVEPDPNDRCFKVAGEWLYYEDDYYSVMQADGSWFRYPHKYDSKTSYKKEILDLFEYLEIKDLIKRFPHELSGGQKQRVAIARALIKDPKILFSDEPTGALDKQSSENIINIFLELNKAGRTIVMVTHNEKFIKHASRVIRIKDGKLYEEK